MPGPEDFRALGVEERLLKAIEAKGFETPSGIQKLAIPRLLSGEKDVIGQARTGTGKTAAFGLPILQELGTDPKPYPRALILSPTRELSIQIASELESLKGDSKLRIAPFYGGQIITVQLAVLKGGIDVVIGTPGRIMDLMRRGKLIFDKLDFAVLDEADEMLDMGFIDDIRAILAGTNPEKRMLLFSATMPEEILRIAEEFMRPGYEVVSDLDGEPTNVELVEQFCCEVRREQKNEALARLLELYSGWCVMVFCRTRADVDEVTEKIVSRGFRAEALHGDISQAQRLKVINGFKAKKFPVLVATDVAARGIDVNDLDCVINYSLPQSKEIYIHRIGRTGRAGSHGTAITFATPGEKRKLSLIEQGVGVRFQKRELPDGREIIEARKQRFAAEMTELLNSGDAKEYLGFAEELLSLGEHPAEVLSAMLKLRFGDGLSEEKYASLRPAREETDDPDMKKLFLYLGRENGLTVPLLLETIGERTGLRGSDLGKILIRAEKSFIYAKKAVAEKILHAFRNDPEFRIKYDEDRATRMRNRRRFEGAPEEGMEKPFRTKRRFDGTPEGKGERPAKKRRPDDAPWKKKSVDRKKRKKGPAAEE